MITEGTRIQLVVSGMQNRTFGPYLAAMDRILLGPVLHAEQDIWSLFGSRALGTRSRIVSVCPRYVAKGLADRVSVDPPVIRLRFQHKVADQEAGVDAFYAQSKANRCVGCGEEGHYLRWPRPEPVRGSHGMVVRNKKFGPCLGAMNNARHNALTADCISCLCEIYIG
jgi:hypothetical protein